MSLNNKIIIVTDGSSGIGFNIAKHIVINNGIVILIGKNKKKLNEKLEILNNISKNKHYIYNIDISKIKKIKKLSIWLKNNFEDIYGLINCAGVIGSIGKTYNINTKDFKKALNINLMGTIYMCNMFINNYSNGSNKKIINFSGGGSTSPLPNFTSYSVSKIGIIKYTENLSYELDNFDINCVAPGFVKTKIHNKTLKEKPEIVGEDYYYKTKKLIKKGHVSPDISSKLCLFLLSNKSDNITGKLISAQWDNWSDIEFQNKLKTDKDLATLRRIDNLNYIKK